MNTRNHLARGLAAAALLVLSASASACAPPRSSAAAAVRAETYSFADGDGATGSVFRAVAGDGSEALRGVTDVPAEGGALRVVESATLDAAGRLVRAEIVVSRGCEGPVEAHVIIDRARGTVRADAPGGTVEWPVPSDAPWVLESVAPGGATPITAWITARAAAAGESVRVIRADRRLSYRTPVEQVAIAHERGTTVMVGEAVAEADAAFVRGVRRIGGDHALARRSDAAATLSCASIAGSGALAGVAR